MSSAPFYIPADVPNNAHQEYQKNYTTITANNGRLFLFAADQKIEHLNNDFNGRNIHPDAAHPEHLFKIASTSPIGAFATHLGLIARYGKQYPTIPYIVKLNGKTDLVNPKYTDPISEQLWSVDDVITFKKNSGLPICGIGYTLYIGSTHESRMLAQAAQAIFQAHQHGLVTILWVYARGKSVKDDQDANVLAGATGIAASLASDFVKIKSPKKIRDITSALAAAGNTKVIFSGGASIQPHDFLETLEAQLQAGAHGCATGRNIFQKSFKDASNFTQAISSIINGTQTAQQASEFYANTR